MEITEETKQEILMLNLIKFVRENETLNGLTNEELLNVFIENN